METGGGATKTRKEARDDRAKEQKIEETVLRSLDDAATTEEKFKMLLRKHVENEREMRQKTKELKLQQKALETVLREKEALQREHNKEVLMRDKLQEVCREQQKLIKSVKNESLQRQRDEEELRKQSQTKFQASLAEITVSLNKNNDENLKLRDNNIEMANKLKFLAEQYHAREQQMEKLSEQIKLEQQLNEAKLAKLKVESAMEKDILTKEKQIALEKLMHYQKMVKELAEREISLKEQLQLYTSKYDEFQKSLQKSNDIFATYKVEMEKMSKNTRKLEKEANEWKRKWEKSNATLIELATEKQQRDDHATRCNKQVDQLQKLLRALQHERSHLYGILREQNIEIPSMPPLPAEPDLLKTTPVDKAGDKDKMDMMTKNCAELKQTLSNLQDQMKYLNIKGAEAEAQAKQVQQQEEKNKKQPKKKNNNNNNKSKQNKTLVKTSTPATEKVSKKGNGAGKNETVTPIVEEKNANQVVAEEIVIPVDVADVAVSTEDNIIDAAPLEMLILQDEIEPEEQTAEKQIPVTEQTLEQQTPDVQTLLEKQIKNVEALETQTEDEQAQEKQEAEEQKSLPLDDVNLAAASLAT